MIMSTAPRWSEGLEQPDSRSRLTALSIVANLPAMMTVTLDVGLGVARWLLETELNRFAPAPQMWPNCPHCGNHLHVHSGASSG